MMVPHVSQVLRVIDALATQGRLIVHLNCGHNLSISKEHVDAGFMPLRPEAGHSFTCPLCPLEAEQKSATQLWKEAGEP